jgi:hypothetical protein
VTREHYPLAYGEMVIVHLHLVMAVDAGGAEE